MKTLLAFLCLLSFSALGQLPSYQRQFFSTNLDPVNQVTAGSNAFVTYSAAGQTRTYRIDVPTGGTTYTNAASGAGTNLAAGVILGSQIGTNLDVNAAKVNELYYISNANGIYFQSSGQSLYHFGGDLFYGNGTFNVTPLGVISGNGSGLTDLPVSAMPAGFITNNNQAAVSFRGGFNSTNATGSNVVIANGQIILTNSFSPTNASAVSTNITRITQGYFGQTNGAETIFFTNGTITASGNAVARQFNASLDVSVGSLASLFIGDSRLNNPKDGWISLAQRGANDSGGIAFGGIAQYVVISFVITNWPALATAGNATNSGNALRIQAGTNGVGGSSLIVNSNLVALTYSNAAVQSARISRTSNVASNYTALHGFSNSERVTMLDFVDNSFNVPDAVVTVVDANSFTWPTVGTNMTDVTNTTGRFWRETGRSVVNGQEISTSGTITGTNGGRFGAAVTTTSSSTNAPSANEFVTGSWVRGLLSGGQLLYNITNAHVSWTNYDVWYTASTTTNAVAQTRTYNSVSLDQYLGTGICSTQRYTTVFSPMTVNAYLSFNTGGGRSVSVKPEFYYCYQEPKTNASGVFTNIWGDYSAGGQALIAGTNLYTWVIPFPTITSTNTDGFYVIRRFKVTAAANTPNVTIHGSGDTPSTIGFQNPAVSDPSLGVRGAIAATLDGVTQSYDTNSRTLTLTNTAVPAGSITSGTMAAARLPSSAVQLNLQGVATNANSMSVNTNLWGGPTNVLGAGKYWWYSTSTNMEISGYTNTSTTLAMSTVLIITNTSGATVPVRILKDNGAFDTQYATNGANSVLSVLSWGNGFTNHVWRTLP